MSSGTHYREGIMANPNLPSETEVVLKRIASALESLAVALPRAIDFETAALRDVATALRKQQGGH
jgi:hypothetical protein